MGKVVSWVVEIRGKVSLGEEFTGEWKSEACQRWWEVIERVVEVSGKFYR